MKVAVIPARGGSKRIPRKNIKLFHGKPMIVWSIEAAIASKCFDHVIVSTDDKEIADIAQNAGAQIPFLRPTHLADDNTGTTPVISDAIEALNRLNVIPNYVCCIYATAPFLVPENLRIGLDKLINSDADYVFTVTRYPSPIQRALKIKDTGRLEMFQPDHFFTRSQDLEESFHDAGQFYWGRSNAWTNKSLIFSEKSIPIVLPSYQVQDIDTNEDWTRAEIMFEAFKKFTL